MTQSRFDDALARLFTDARTHSSFLPKRVEDAVLRRAFDLARMGPTAANAQPMRVVFVKSAESKQRLAPAMAEGNLAKTLAAPVTAILAYDTRFYDALPRLFPHTDARAWFAGEANAGAAAATGEQSATLQIAYFLLACRAVGLDCGPMGGFDKAAVDAAFFADGRYRSLLVMNIGYGDPAALHPRNPRLDFDEACQFA